MSEGASPPITGDDLDRLEQWCRSIDADLLADGPTCIWEDLIAALRAAERMAEALAEHHCAYNREQVCEDCAALTAYRRRVSPFQ